MLSKNELVQLIIDYDNNHNLRETITKLARGIDELYEVQAKLIKRLNAYHSDTLALMESPEAIYEWNSQLTLDMNNEVYKLLGIKPPIQDI
jgi:hypothetical protein